MSYWEEEMERIRNEGFFDKLIDEDEADEVFDRSAKRISRDCISSRERAVISTVFDLALVFPKRDESSDPEPVSWILAFMLALLSIRMIRYSIVEQANSLIYTLKDVPKEDMSRMPPLKLTFLDDGSVLLEWIFDGRRLGFTIEEEPAESGWYYVSSERYGDFCESGSLKDVKSRVLAKMIKRAIDPRKFTP
jgi:hypothetical protein